jgi:hypothetical protein
LSISDTPNIVKPGQTLPPTLRQALGRLLLSSGKIVKSQRNTTVPLVGRWRSQEAASGVLASGRVRFRRLRHVAGSKPGGRGVWQ